MNELHCILQDLGYHNIVFAHKAIVGMQLELLVAGPFSRLVYVNRKPIKPILSKRHLYAPSAHRPKIRKRQPLVVFASHPWIP